MEPFVLLIWVSTLAVAVAGAVNALTGRQLVALAVNAVAATLTIAIVGWLEPKQSALFVATGGFASSVFLAPIVMWTILAGSAGVALTRRRWLGSAA